MTPPLFQLEAPTGLFQDLTVEPEEARSILRPQRHDHPGYGFTLSPYRGCGHGCRYCYVREYPQPIPGAEGGALHRAEDWGSWAVPKLNAPELLWSQRHRLHGQGVFLSTGTDPYQPLEREYRLTRGCLEVLLQCPTTRVLVHTRAPLILQDLALLQQFGSRLAVNFSIPTDDDTVRQVVEPKAPPIPSRWAAVERLARAGIQVDLAVAPLMPMQDPAVFARRAQASGVRGVWVGGLRLLAQDPFQDLLARQDWLQVLDPGRVAGVRAAMAEVFPGQPGPGRRRQAKAAAVVAMPPVLPLRAQQPSLFDAM